MVLRKLRETTGPLNISDPSPSIFIRTALAESYPEFRSYPDIGQFLSGNRISLFFLVFSAIFCYFHVFLHALEQRKAYGGTCLSGPLNGMYESYPLSSAMA